MTIEERQARITEIIARQEELDTEFRGMTFTNEARDEFEALATERVEQDNAVAELEQRRSYLEEQARQTESREGGSVFQTARPGASAATTSTTSRRSARRSRTPRRPAPNCTTARSGRSRRRRSPTAASAASTRRSTSSVSSSVTATTASSAGSSSRPASPGTGPRS
jgi:hypothetical protein